MRYWPGWVIGAAALGMLLFTSSPARSDDPVASSVRFNREIVRIFDRKCLACHGRNAIGMPLSTYREVRPWSRAIREEIVEGRMPPTSAVRGYARLKDDISLSPRELATILTWVDGGVPRGDDSDLPASPKAALPATPDHAITLPAQPVPGGGEDVVRHVTVASGLDQARWVRTFEVRPGDRRLLRAAFVSILAADGTSVWAGSWVPWQTAVNASAPGAFLIPRGARLVVDLHYRGGDAPASDTPTIALFFAGDGEWSPMQSVSLAPRPSTSAAASKVSKAETVLDKNSLIWGIRLDLPADGVSAEVTARRPDGPVEVLLWVPRSRTEWPAPFYFQEPVALPAGTVISVTTAGTAAPSGARAVLTLHRAN